MALTARQKQVRSQLRQAKQSGQVLTKAQQDRLAKLNQTVKDNKAANKAATGSTKTPAPAPTDTSSSGPQVNPPDYSAAGDGYSDTPENYPESSAKQKAIDEASAQAAADKWYSEGSLGRLNPDYKPLETTVAQREAEYAKAQQDDPYIKAALERMQGGLEGISAPENQALREQGQAQIKQQAKSSLRALRGFNLANNAKGGAAGYGAYNILRDQNANLARQESDLIASNVAEKGRRLGQFADYANTAYQTQFGARQSALDRLSQDRTGLSDFRTATDTFNLGQGEKEKAGALGVYYGDIGLNLSRRAQDYERTLANKEFEAAKKGLGINDKKDKAKAGTSDVTTGGAATKKKRRRRKKAA